MTKKQELYVDNPFCNPAVLSFCPGFLGLERGTERAIGRLRVAAYVEIEAFIVANLMAGMEAGMVDAAPVWNDIKTFHQVAKHFRGKIHGILGGYPCQPFSSAGKRKGKEDPRHLWPFIYRAVETIRPVWCFFENVSGHLTMGYPEVYKDLRNLGYSVEAGLFTAEEVGAPHERERLFILAIDEQFLADSEGGQSRQPPTGYWWQSISRRSEESMGHTGSNVHQVGLGGGADHPGTEQDKGEGDQRERIWPEPGTTSEELANSTKPRNKRPELGESEREPWDNEFTDSNKKLAHTHSSGQPQQRHNGQQGCQDNDRVGNTGTEISNTCSTDVQRGNRLQESAGQPEFTNNDRWPAQPGQPQYDWEEKRTVEPGMGSTINGYNFREDLLRAYGNKVVEQTAEVAFIDLLKKHIRNLSIINDQKPSFGG